jgi:ATP-binding cassette subfamily F protein 3
VGLSIDEGRIYCILSPSGSGKSTLLRVLAKLEEPVEGEVKHVLNLLGVAFLDHNMIDVMFDIVERTAKETALSFLAKRFPLKTEEDIRGELKAFGLSPQQPLTKLLFLSGVKRARLRFCCNHDR